MDNNNQIIIYQTDDDQTQIDVRMENDTVWLTQAQMADLFQKDRTVISRHIRNVFKEGELEKENNVHFLHVNGIKTVATAQAVQATGPRVKTGTAATMTTMACQVSMRMMIMISNAFNKCKLNKKHKNICITQNKSLPLQRIM